TFWAARRPYHAVGNTPLDSALVPRRRRRCYGAIVRQPGFHAFLVRRFHRTQTDPRFPREGHGLGSRRPAISVCRRPARREAAHRLLRLLLSSGGWHRGHRDRLPIKSRLLEPRTHHRSRALCPRSRLSGLEAVARHLTDSPRKRPITSRGGKKWNEGRKANYVSGFSDAGVCNNSRGVAGEA